MRESDIPSDMKVSVSTRATYPMNKLLSKAMTQYRSIECKTVEIKKLPSVPTTYSIIFFCSKLERQCFLEILVCWSVLCCFNPFTPNYFQLLRLGHMYPVGSERVSKKLKNS